MIDYIYILSAAKSGSTLLAMLLGSHPEAVTVGETCSILDVGTGDTGLCSCGSAVRDCQFWKKVFLALADRGVGVEGNGLEFAFRARSKRLLDSVLRMNHRGPVMEWTRDRLLTLYPPWRSTVTRIRNSNRALFGLLVEMHRARLFIDSSKNAHHLKLLMGIPSLKVKVIHLVRDGRGVAASWMKRDKLPIEVASEEWRREIVSQEHLLNQLPPETCTRIRYEDLCKDVEGSMRHLLGFAGLDPATWVRDFRAREHHVIGNRMRMQHSSEITLDEKWREMLTDKDCQVFEGLAGKWNRRYGYA